MGTYQVVEVTGRRGFRHAGRKLLDPGPSQVWVRVEACGICHTGAFAVEGLRDDPATPVMPGHEIVGVIDAVGQGVTAWAEGDRVGVGLPGWPLRRMRPVPARGFRELPPAGAHR